MKIWCRILCPKKETDMGHLGEGAKITSVSTQKVVLTADNGQNFTMEISDWAEAVRRVMNLSYSTWTGRFKIKLTKDSCYFMFVLYGSVYIVTCVGDKAATISKLRGSNDIEFREDLLGNVYALAIGMYFIQRIGYNTPNIIAEETSEYPPDCTTLVVK